MGQDDWRRVVSPQEFQLAVGPLLMLVGGLLSALLGHIDFVDGCSGSGSSEDFAGSSYPFEEHSWSNE